MIAYLPAPKPLVVTPAQGSHGAASARHVAPPLGHPEPPVETTLLYARAFRFALVAHGRSAPYSTAAWKPSTRKAKRPGGRPRIPGLGDRDRDSGRQTTPGARNAPYPDCHCAASLRVGGHGAKSRGPAQTCQGRPRRSIRPGPKRLPRSSGDIGASPLSVRRLVFGAPGRQAPALTGFRAAETDTRGARPIFPEVPPALPLRDFPAFVAHLPEPRGNPRLGGRPNRATEFLERVIPGVPAVETRQSGHLGAESGAVARLQAGRGHRRFASAFRRSASAMSSVHRTW